MSYEYFDYEELEVLEDECDDTNECEIVEAVEFGGIVGPEGSNISDRHKNKKVYKNIKNVNDMLRGTSRFDFEADMLEAIFERPPLYDYTLPIKSRSPSAINCMWYEIKSDLEDKYPNLTISIEMLKIMYKNLRNNYTRYKTGKDKATPSGTASKIIPEPKHIDKLRRLDGVLQKRKQKSSLELDLTEASQHSSPFPENNDSENLDESNVPRKRTRTLSSNKSITPAPSPSAADFLEPLQRLVANVNNKGKVDMAQLLGNQVTLFMRELNIEEQYEAQLYFTTYMNNIIKNKTNK